MQRFHGEEEQHRGKGVSLLYTVSMAYSSTRHSIHYECGICSMPVESHKGHDIQQVTPINCIEDLRNVHLE
jgi:hypothetical protein